MESRGSDFPYNTDYETVAASATNQVLGNLGAQGDIIYYLDVVPLAGTVGIVQLKDGSGTAFTIYGGGDVIPDTRGTTVRIHLNIKSALGAWQVSTGLSVNVIAVGRFT